MQIDHILISSKGVFVIEDKYIDANLVDEDEAIVECGEKNA